MTFEDWWEDYIFLVNYELTTKDLRSCYEAGWNALADLTDGPTYEEVMSHEDQSI